jgi:hypothetical protein
MADVGKLDVSTVSPIWAAETYDAGHWAFMGFKLKAVKNLAVTAHGALYNLGAFDKFGYGKLAEFVKYDNIIPGLGAGITVWQEFYGGDVMRDGITNSPFLRFTPEVSYKYKIITGSLEGTIGVCPDVLDSYWEIKPQIQVSLNRYMDVFTAQVFYKATGQDFVDSTGIAPTVKHTFGVALDLIF